MIVHLTIRDSNNEGGRFAHGLSEIGEIWDEQDDMKGGVEAQCDGQKGVWNAESWRVTSFTAFCTREASFRGRCLHYGYRSSSEGCSENRCRLWGYHHDSIASISLLRSRLLMLTLIGVASLSSCSLVILTVNLFVVKKLGNFPLISYIKISNNYKIMIWIVQNNVITEFGL